MVQKSTVVNSATVVSQEDGTPIPLVIVAPAVALSGASTTFTVKLPCQPSANITVRSQVVDGDGSFEVSSGSPLTFTTSNWNTPQTVTLTSSKRYDGGWGRVLVTASGADYPGFGAVTFHILVS
jgi:cellulose 1,4-beta-cellobiosidase